MKKKGLNLLVATFVLICCIICSFALVACSKSDANGYVGTYYEYKNGQKTDFWIKLDKDAWSSSDEAGGRLEINGEEVTAYAKIFGEEDVFFTGTVKDGVLTYSMIRGMEYKAYKDGAYENGSTGNENNPNNPDTPNKETFTVTFNTVGGSSVSNATVSSGNTVAAPADPTKSGYNFVGWYSDSSYTNKWQFTTPVRSNITLYAKWEAQIAKYTVSFDSNGGSAVTSVQVNDGDTVAVPAAPTKSGYNFVGWYSDSSYTNKWQFSTPVRSNITLYAKWEAQIAKYTVSFDSNGGSAVASVQVNDGDTVAVPADPTKSGYNFVGWYSDSFYTNRWQFTTPVRSNITLYAKWEAQIARYTVSFDSNGGSAVASVQVNDGDKLTAPTQPVKETYVFVGWYKDSGFTQVWDFDTDTVTKNITLYAKWKKEVQSQVYVRQGNNIYFGTYPQTKVTDDIITTALNNMAGTLPTSDNSANWTSYGYYISGSVSNFMWYIDLEYNGEKYRGVYFTFYRPAFTTSSSADYSHYDDNGYYTSTVYWFRYDSIKWTILDENDGKVLILADLALDSQQYYRSDYENTQTRNGKSVYANDYAESDIRKWLNDTFYNVAFNNLQKALIETTAIETTGYNYKMNTNNSIQIITEDKIFLLSPSNDLGKTNNINSNVARQKKSTDYAKSQGCTTVFYSGYKGNCYWWIRSLNFAKSFCVNPIDYGGSYFGSNLTSTAIGVVPALWIKLN
ncbi:MAG: InlB B-repeat-containing protein [Clostridiales bacterium]|nr:InlB B-repeat-containing protein [Clostridiales bacterium]